MEEKIVSNSDFKKAELSVYSNIVELIKVNGFTLSIVDDIILEAMRAVNTIKNLDGSQKAALAKELIFLTLDKMVEENMCTKENIDELKSAINTLGPTVFNLIIYAQKNDIFNAEKIKKTCGCILS